METLRLVSLLLLLGLSSCVTTSAPGSDSFDADPLGPASSGTARCGAAHQDDPVLEIMETLKAEGALDKAVDSMEGNAAASEPAIRHSQSLCDGEQDFVCKRKQVVLESLKSLGIDCAADEVPHIALSASGGGERATVSLLGFLSQMEKEGLLETLLYIGGVSGSTWAMASLYTDPQWSTNVDATISRLFGPGVDLEKAVAWLEERAKQEDFSLSDAWGLIIAAGIMKQLDLRHLSDEASRNATNPYPIYCAVEDYCLSYGPIEGTWFEISPHEAGFIELGLFVETSLLGSKFQGGKLLKKKPEMDMVTLQGVLGSALAREETIGEFIPPWLNGPGLIDVVAKEYLRAYDTLIKLVALIRSTTEDPTTLSELDKLEKTLEEKVNQNKSAWRESMSLEERQSLYQELSLELLEGVQSWSQNLTEGAFKTHVSLLTQRILPLILKWEWGTTENFLYQYPEEKDDSRNSSIPPCLRSKERLNLIDAGLHINVPLPLFLGDKRHIDLIIAPEYSAGEMFETLTLTRDYAVALKKPFPEIDDKKLQEERDWPKGCYVFEGKEKEPTIVFMPLFNRDNCRDAEEVKERMKEFRTFQPPFNKQKIEFLLETAKANMKKNKETLLQEINKAVLRKQRRKRVGDDLGAMSSPSPFQEVSDSCPVFHLKTQNL